MTDNKYHARITSYWRARFRRRAAEQTAATSGTAGAHNGAEAATGRASENERCGWRHNATEAAGQEAVTQGNVGDARSVLARS